MSVDNRKTRIPEVSEPKPTPETFGLTVEKIALIRQHEADRLQAKEAELRTQSNRSSNDNGCFVIAGVLGVTSVCLFMSASKRDAGEVFFLAFVFFLLALFAWRMAEVDRQEHEEARRQAMKRSVPRKLEKHPHADTLTAFDKALERWTYQQKDTWVAKTGYEFEKDFGSLLNRCGWQVTVTKASGDGGVDIEGIDPAGVQCLLQCKWWKHRCGVQPVRELAGVLAVSGKGRKGIIVCKGGFTSAAKAFARQANISLWGLEIVMSLVRDPRD